MGHVAIVGPTECGKTTLAKQLAASFRASGVHVLVCDPLYDEWPATWQTLKIQELIDAAKQARRCALFVDEAGMTVRRGRDAPDVEWLFTTARHWGHSTHVLSQGGTQLTPTMRAQCSSVYLFGSTPGVAELWASEFNEPGLAAAPSLQRFECLFKQRFQPLRRVRIALPTVRA